MFRATNSPILGSTFWLYIQLWYSSPKLLPTGPTVEMELTTSVPSQPWHLSAAVSVHFTKSCIYSQKLLLRMGEFFARNMWGWIKKINKRKWFCILLVIYIVVASTDHASNETTVEATGNEAVTQFREFNERNFTFSSGTFGCYQRTKFLCLIVLAQELRCSAFGKNWKRLLLQHVRSSH